LAAGGRLLVYGTLANQPLTVDPRVLMVKNARIEGFWLSNWMRHQNAFKLLRLFRRLSRLLADGTLATDIAGSYPLCEFRAAVQQATTPGREGKVLLRMDGQ
jgi:NADPH:quinone reductase-like Zn-dependent oxidoreductase